MLFSELDVLTKIDWNVGHVRSMLCYRAMVWGHRAPDQMAKFMQVNRMAINMFPSFPTAALEVMLLDMLDFTALHLHCEQEALTVRG